MLRLAKTESKKEMSLKKKKIVKIPNEKSKNLIDRIDRNKICKNYNSSNCRIQHKIIKKENISNKANNSIHRKPKQNSVIFLRSINNTSNLKKNMPMAKSPTNKANKKYSFENDPINTVNIKKCDSIRGRSKNIIKYNNINNSYNFLDLEREKGKEIKNEKNKLLRTIENGRIRKLFSFASDIFNLDNTATNLFERKYLSPKSSNYYRIIYKKENNKFTNDLNGFFSNNKNNRPYNILSNNYMINGKPKQKNKFNRINIFNRTEYNSNETNSFNIKNKKTNRLNIESVKYDIISTRNSNIFDKYTNLSGIKASSSNIEDYEILIPKDYNKINISNLKGVLNSNGLHIFGVKEEGDIITGTKGKYKVKVRINGQNEKDKNKKIYRASSKLMDLNTKFKRNTYDWGKKKTDITGFGWDEEIKNHLC